MEYGNKTDVQNVKNIRSNVYLHALYPVQMDIFQKKPLIFAKIADIHLPEYQDPPILISVVLAEEEERSSWEVEALVEGVAVSAVEASEEVASVAVDPEVDFKTI